ncbi:MAG TPA: 2OG-Fe(II) oxygenase [Allosphingosinicella sp.]|nr:2OG-Fe(II) oxygenase [Allosphingosinicella sp.]
METAQILARAPGVQRVPTPKLTLFIRRNFLAPDECARIIALIDARRRPSTLSDDLGDPQFRTSETCDLDAGLPEVGALERKISQFTGIDGRFGEPIQGQRYAEGEEFKPHTDYFEPNGPDFIRFCSVAGQRTWTVMVYLNEPGAGGATRFKAIGKTVRPETGKLLAWNNLRADGAPNADTLHHGMKVRAGTKYIVTKWFRERPWR